jgi:hypothetical protein
MTNIKRKKYNRTYHVPWSEGVQSDDKINKKISCFKDKIITVNEKLDGECTTMYGDINGLHARSTTGVSNWTRDWCKKLQMTIMNDIPEGYRFCGENVFGEHSIRYDDLESYFYLFSIWNDKNECLSWDETLEWANIIDLATPKEFYRGVYNEDILKDIAKNIDTATCEGYVIRTVDGFHYDNFSNHIAKWVRKGHVQTDEHWLKNTKPNGLKKGIIKPSYMR